MRVKLGDLAAWRETIPDMTSQDNKHTSYLSDIFLGSFRKSGQRQASLIRAQLSFEK